MALNPPANYLPINLPERPRILGATAPKFQDHKEIGKFSIDKDQQYSEDSVEIPEIISSEKIRQLEGTYLGDGYDTASLITDYRSYHALKYGYFFKWLSNNYFVKVEADETLEKPKFICFGGLIIASLTTPLISRNGGWGFFAARVKDCIFLWNIKKSGNESTLESFYGVGYEALMTGKDPKTVHQSEKVWVIEEVKFGSHQLLLANHVNAVDKNGDWVEITVFKRASDRTMDNKYLKYWGENVVVGVDKTFLGERDDVGILVGTEESISTDNLLRKSTLSYSSSKCFRFEDRLLAWISSHFTENDPKVVKRFSWAGVSNENIECEILSSTEEVLSVFPNEFLE